VNLLPTPVVYLVDDCPNDVRVIRRVCESIGLSIQSYESARALLAELPQDAQGCIVVDLLMPEMSGLQLHEELQIVGSTLPIIVLTGHADARTCREAFHRGVFDFVEKSPSYHDLVVVIQKAIESNQSRHTQDETRKTFLQDVQSLSPREIEVMELLSKGLSQKEIAEQMEISVQTASKHRSKVLEKLHVNNEVDLLKRMWAINTDPQCFKPSSAA
jgi:two-component system, LuxR family, response regulator FixJ